MENTKLYANLDENGKVVRILSGDLNTLKENYYGIWVDSLIDHETKQRANIGMSYNKDLEIFYDELPDQTGYWVLDSKTGRYNNIKPYPNDMPEVKEWSWDHLIGKWEPWSSAFYKTDSRIKSKYPDDGLFYRYIFETDTWKRVEYIEGENGNFKETELS